MAFEWYLFVGIFLAVVIIGWYVLGKVAKGVRSVISSVFLILLIAGTAFLFWESNDLQKKFASAEKFFVYTADDTVVAAFHTTTGMPVVSDDLTLQRIAYGAGDLQQLKGGSYKVLIFTPDAFAAAGTLNLSGVILSADEALALLRSTTPKRDYIARYASQHNINGSVVNDNQLGTDDNLRGLVFASLVGDISQKGNILMMTRTGGLTIYPESLSLWLIRTMPDILIPYFVGTTGGP